MAQSTTFTCRCGSVSGTLSGINPKEGTHLVCHCDSCVKAMTKAGIVADKGVAIFQTTPDRIKIDKGLDKLEPRQWTPGGLYRWHTICCDTPMFNTMGSPSLPFTGMLIENFADPSVVGPPIAQGHVVGDDGKPRYINGNMILWRFFKRTLTAKLTGRGRKNPFFGADRKPIAPPTPLL